MDVLATGINAAVVAIVGLLVAWHMNGRFKQTEQRIQRLEDAMSTRMDGFQRSLDGLRSDLTNVALAVGAKPEAEAGG